MQFHLTTAGLAAFPNPAHTGSNAILIDRVGVSAVALPGAPEDHAGLVALPNELKRLSTFGGASVGDNILHLTVRDESSDTYTLRTFGLYSSTGVLLAYVTSSAPISEKTASSMTLIAADLAFVSVLAAEVNFGSTEFLNPPATTIAPGVVELATKEETALGVDAARAVTPYGLRWVLDQLLSGFAALVHNHDAAAIVSGVLNVGRIPAIPQEKVTGLAATLAAKSDTGHNHSAADIVSGVLSVLRIPDLTMSKITDLSTALAAKLDVAGFTWALLPGRPAIISPDTDALLKSLQLKLATPTDGRLYFGDQVIGGRRLDFNGDTFRFVGAPLTINGYSPWTNQTFNPADKAAAIHSHDWTQITGRPDLVINYRAAITARGAEGNGYVAMSGGDEDRSGACEFYDASGNRVGVIQASANDATLTFSAEAGYGLNFDQRPTFEGLVPWDAGNFSPASKANVAHTHAQTDVVGLASALAGKAALAHSHVAADITDLLDKFWPANQLKLFDQASPPAGVRVLVANGATVSRTTYSRLFGAIGTRYGAGDGATTFHLPDWRGVFFRGLDNGRGLDTGRALGVLQMSQNLAHDHTYLRPAGADNGVSGIDPNPNWTSSGATTSSSGGSEARPTNQALLACVTY